MSERIFVMCPDDNGAIGGVKQLYRHVDVLNKYGMDAKVLHREKGYRCTWFANETKTTSWSEFKWKDDDILVLPEIYGPRMAQSLKVRKHRRLFSPKRYWEQGLPKVRKVIFNQNCYNTFARYSFDPNDLDTPYLDPLVIATIVVSEDSREYINSVFPEHPIYRIRNAIKPGLFEFQEQKKKQICFMPRKHREEAEAVINSLKFRGVFKGYAIQPIDNSPEAEVARIMKESLIFLSFGYPEGLPLPPMEAMISGCIVIGYHGGGAREYLLPSHSFPIEATDIRTFARTIEEVLLRCDTDMEKLDEMRTTASKFISENYSLANEEKDICSAWQKILGREIG